MRSIGRARLWAIRIAGLALVALAAFVVSSGDHLKRPKGPRSRTPNQGDIGAEQRVSDPGAPVRERVLAGADVALHQEAATDPAATPPPNRLTIELRLPNDEPASGFGIEVDYDMRRGSHGMDQGKTDSAGRFTTAAQLPFEIEDIRVVQGFDMPLTLASSALAAHPDRPSVLVVKLPRLHEIKVQVEPPAQPDGSNWAVWVEPVGGLSVDPFVSVPIVDEYGGFYATDGTLSMTVAEARYSVHLSESDQEAIEVLVDRDPTTVLFQVEPIVEVPEPPERVLAIARGRVVDAKTGTGVRALVRTMLDPGPPGRFGRWSEDDGSFEITLPRRVRFISAAADEYAFSIVGPFDASDPQNIELRLERPVAVTGRVVDRRGAAITSGRVRLYRSSTQLRESGRALAPAPLDASFEWVTLLPKNGGAFSFEDATEGPILLRYEPYDADSQPGEVLARGGNDDVVIVAGEIESPVSVVRVRITDAIDGSPLHRIAVALQDEPLPHYLTRRPEAGFTNQRGDALLCASVGAETAVSAWILPRARRRYTAQTIEGIKLVDGTVAVDVQLEPATTVYVRAVDGTGAPLAAVRLRPMTRSGGVIHLQTPHGQPETTSASTGRNGRADLRGVPASGFTLDVEWRVPGDSDVRSRQVTVDPAEHGGKLWTLVLD